MKIPIVMAAFGTTTRAIETYSFIDETCRKHFPGHEILWAYSSRMVKDWIKKRRNIDLKHPHQVLEELKENGHSWAVVQSLHLVCGHEFYRLVEEVKQSSVRTSIGLPLLSDPEDYEAVVQGLGSSFPDIENEAIVLVGHGTDHPMWAAYIALEHWLQRQYGSNIHVGTVEDKDSCEQVLQAVKKGGKRKILLIPFMIVAGVHFKEDLMGNQEDSWKSRFEKEGIDVRAIEKGLGLQAPIVEIFIDHTREALDVIPS